MWDNQKVEVYGGLNLNTGIIGYGAYIPRYRLKVEEVARIWGDESDKIKESLVVKEKSVPAPDEDTATISVESARNAVKRSQIDPQEIGAIYVGSESHPYAVKPTATMVSEAIRATPNLTAADYEFACKAGTAAIQSCMGLVEAGVCKYGMAIGADTAQSRPGDALEYTAAAGGGAFIIGEDGDNSIAKIDGTYSYTTDTPDFWRREMEPYPEHGGRFTGKPAYFKHVLSAANGLLRKLELTPQDFDYVVFHQPNGKFPLKASKRLGFEREKVEPGLLTPEIGNTYSGATLIGLAAILDQAEPEDKILAVSFGSGAGSDAFALTVKDAIKENADSVPKVRDYVKDKEYISYGKYTKSREMLVK